MIPVTVPPIRDDLLDALFARADAARWGLSRDRFAATLQKSCDHRFPAIDGADDRERTGSAPTDESVSAYLTSLHLEDLALACACRDGHAPAWDHFLADVLPRVRASARSMAGETGAHLADDLLADLYGVVERDGSRRPLFDYFHGRSRLTTWLRTVVAQRHVDELRSTRRLVSLDASSDGGDDRRSVDDRLPVGDREGRAVETRTVAAVDRTVVLGTFQRELELAVERLDPADRLRLAYYYGQDLTLARIGRVMGEHESSVSRKLERTRRQLRREIVSALTATHGFTEADVRQCLEEAGMGEFDLMSLLEGKSGEG